MTWICNGRPLDLKSNQIEFGEPKQTDEGVKYDLKIKSAEIGKNDGEYLVKVKPKPNDKSEISSGAAIVKILPE